ncbi:hypothetical protein [Candidatus Enterococcus clewellii]|uniref:Uncharacterized protein n=1 Tax=Candidatus Enterococcus clewellii TaxID=1834193 RepID=A0A242K2F7_9ENTE|nr:hypothetical protein [Enterococcus sp. 9E7_DIV0242]OTP12686.1 hypothetical protein A5888_003264 [Enterococcus sp. 9E7_DIV0242]
MDRKEALHKAKLQADEWYRVHKPLIEAYQYLERLNQEEKLDEVKAVNQ